MSTFLEVSAGLRDALDDPSSVIIALSALAAERENLTKQNSSAVTVLKRCTAFLNKSARQQRFANVSKLLRFVGTVSDHDDWLLAGSTTILPALHNIYCHILACTDPSHKSGSNSINVSISPCVRQSRSAMQALRAVLELVIDYCDITDVGCTKHLFVFLRTAVAVLLGSGYQSRGDAVNETDYALDELARTASFTLYTIMTDCPGSLPLAEQLLEERVSELVDFVSSSPEMSMRVSALLILRRLYEHGKGAGSSAPTIRHDIESALRAAEFCGEDGLSTFRALDLSSEDEHTRRKNLTAMLQTSKAEDKCIRTSECATQIRFLNVNKKKRVLYERHDLDWNRNSIAVHQTSKGATEYWPFFAVVERSWKRNLAELHLKFRPFNENPGAYFAVRFNAGKVSVDEKTNLDNRIARAMDLVIRAPPVLSQDRKTSMVLGKISATPKTVRQKNDHPPPSEVNETSQPASPALSPKSQSDSAKSEELDVGSMEAPDTTSNLDNCMNVGEGATGGTPTPTPEQSEAEQSPCQEVPSPKRRRSPSTESRHGSESQAGEHEMNTPIEESDGPVGKKQKVKPSRGVKGSGASKKARAVKKFKTEESTRPSRNAAKKTMKRPREIKRNAALKNGMHPNKPATIEGVRQSNSKESEVADLLDDDAMTTPDPPTSSSKEPSGTRVFNRVAETAAKEIIVSSSVSIDSPVSSDDLADGQTLENLSGDVESADGSDATWRFARDQDEADDEFEPPEEESPDSDVLVRSNVRNRGKANPRLKPDKNELKSHAAVAKTKVDKRASDETWQGSSDLANGQSVPSDRGTSEAEDGEEEHIAMDEQNKVSEGAESSDDTDAMGRAPTGAGRKQCHVLGFNDIEPQLVDETKKTLKKLQVTMREETTKNETNLKALHGKIRKSLGSVQVTRGNTGETLNNKFRAKVEGLLQRAREKMNEIGKKRREDVAEAQKVISEMNNQQAGQRQRKAHQRKMSKELQKSEAPIAEIGKVMDKELQKLATRLRKVNGQKRRDSMVSEIERLLKRA